MRSGRNSISCTCLNILSLVDWEMRSGGSYKPVGFHRKHPSFEQNPVQGSPDGTNSEIGGVGVQWGRQLAVLKAPASMRTLRGIAQTEIPMPPHIRRLGQCQGLDKTPREFCRTRDEH